MRRLALAAALALLSVGARSLVRAAPLPAVSDVELQLTDTASAAAAVVKVAEPAAEAAVRPALPRVAEAEATTAEGGGAQEEGDSEGARVKLPAPTAAEAAAASAHRLPDVASVVVDTSKLPHVRAVEESQAQDLLPRAARKKATTFNLTGPYRGAWHVRPSAAGVVKPPDLDIKVGGTFHESSGTLTQQWMTWKTNITGIKYLQSALLVRDGRYNSEQDVRISFEGVLDELSGTVHLFSRHSGASKWTPALMLKNASKEERTAYRSTARVRAWEHRKKGNKQGKGGFRDSWFSTAFADQLCHFILKLQHNATASGKPKPLRGPENVRLHGNLTSPDCGHVALAVEVETLSFQEHYQGTFMYITLATFFTIAQLKLAALQVETTDTVALKKRVSPGTLAMMAGIDAFLCITHFSTGLLIESLFNAFAICAFMKFVLFSMLELRFFAQVYKAHLPPETWADATVERRELNKLNGRFYAAIFVVLMLGYQSLLLLRLIVLVMYGFWLPQIIQNALEDAPQPALRKRYIVGMSVTRLVLPLYFFGYHSNYYHMEPHPVYCSFLVLFVVAQMCALLYQHRNGSRSVVPKAFLPVKYDYYRKPSPSEMSEENGALDCVICMEPVEDATKGCMITPCTHIFHAECLVGWLEIKMECPTCRGELPPP